MKNLISVIALSLVVLSGCSTTQKVMDSVGSRKSVETKPVIAPKPIVEQNKTPLAQVLNERSDLRRDLATVEIRQYFNRVENPSVAEVKVTETGLLDDSIKSVRTVYSFKNVDGKWSRVETKKEYQCARGSDTTTFQSKKCS